MERNKRRHLRSLLRREARQYARERTREQPAAQPWHRRYRVRIAVALIVGYAIIYCCLGAPFWDLNPMRGQYSAIHNGMTVEEVESVLDKPNYSDLPEQKIWTSSRGAIVVRFEGHRVCRKEFMPIKLPRRWPRPW
jgi:hypothetical protein